jgi:signal transduction histidine kinase
MGTSRQGRSEKEEKRLSDVDPASRPRAWKIRGFEAASRLSRVLETSRNHRESISSLLRVISSELGIKCHAVYLDETGCGELRLMQSGDVEPGTLPVSINAGSAFAEWLSRTSSPEIMEVFFGSPGDLTESELNARDGFASAGTGSACVLKFGGQVIGIYVFASYRGGGRGPEVLHPAIGILAGITAAFIASQLISSESGRDAAALEKNREREFRAVRNAVLEKTAIDLETSLGVLKSGLWSIDPEPGDGSVMIDMARDAAVSLGARVRELVALSAIEPAGQDIVIEEIDPADIIEDVTREMIADFERRELTLSVDDRSGGRKLRMDPGKLAYVVRSVMENILHSAKRGSGVEIISSFLAEGPDGWDGPWFVIRMSGGAGAGTDDAIEAMLDSLASAQDHEAGPPADSGLTLSKFILESHGGRLETDGDEPGCYTAWLPLGY